MDGRKSDLKIAEFSKRKFPIDMVDGKIKVKMEHGVLMKIDTRLIVNRIFFDNDNLVKINLKNIY